MPAFFRSKDMAKTATWRNTPFAHKFYHSRAWKNARDFVWTRAHGLCERCAEQGELKPADVVHHKIPLNPVNINDPYISLNADNLIALCNECHTEGMDSIIGVCLNDTSKPVKEKEQARFEKLCEEFQMIY